MIKTLQSKTGRMREATQPFLRLVSGWDRPAGDSHVDRTRVDPDAAAPAALLYEKLFRAMRARLDQAARQVPDSHAEESGRVRLRHAREGILECAAALDCVLARLAPDLRRWQGMEGELEAARAELARTQIRERRAQHRATHDALTDLPNRRLFLRRLTHALLRRSRSPALIAVLYIDLDGFKALNDTHGHEAGDDLLRIVAARLAHAARAEDSVGRLGGDEFGFLLTGLPDHRPILDIAGKVFAALAAPVRIGSVTTVIRPSIGIAISPDHGSTADGLLRCADTAMYRAKRHGTGHELFIPS